MQKNIDRRRFIKTSSLLAVAVIVPEFVSCGDSKKAPVDPGCQTSEDILGPFYKAGSPIREDIIPKGSTAPALKITGNVYGSCDKALTNAVVEIWNADETGNYDVSEQYLFRGSYRTEADGNYKFRTIIPGRYLNGSLYRPSHIHFRITAPEHQELISQIYFKNDPYIETDPWASLPKASRRILEVKKDTDDVDIITFDIYLRKA